MKCILIGLLCLAPFLIYCEVMIIHLSNGTTAEYEIQDVQLITFSGGSYTEWEDFFTKVPIRFLSNYPNPFNPSTNIKFELTDNAKTEVTIYNVKGQLVKKLLDGFLKKGTNEVFWDGKDNNGQLCASGNYFYKVRCNNQVKINKMLILK